MSLTFFAHHRTIAAAIASYVLVQLPRAAADDGFGCPRDGYGAFGRPAYEKQALPSVDYDGDPYAYAPDDSGRDFLANAGHPGNWWAIQTDTGRPNGKPVSTTLINPGTGKRQEYYISLSTGWIDGKYVDRVDAKKFSFAVLTSEMIEKGIKLGDWLSVSNPTSGRSICARVQDFGNGGKGIKWSSRLKSMRAAASKSDKTNDLKIGWCIRVSVTTTAAVISEKWGARLSAFDAVFHAVAGAFD
jgi:hypothetical protein